MSDLLLEVIQFLVKFAIVVGGAVAVVSLIYSRLNQPREIASGVTFRVLGKDKIGILTELDRFIRVRGEDNASKKPENLGRVLSFEFDGDVDVSGMDNLEELVDVICCTAMPCDEVVVRLNSYGGSVSRYGLIAESLMRIKRVGCTLTVCIDEAATSGGYLAAVSADKIIAAPFSLIGSIGVVTEMPNFSKLLSKYGVEYQVITAGKYKRTVDMYSPITDFGREKHASELEAIHEQFKNYVLDCRPRVNLEAVSTGECWTGKAALELGLVDELLSYREYLWRKCLDDRRVVLLLSCRTRVYDRVIDRISSNVGAVIRKALSSNLVRRS